MLSFPNESRSYDTTRHCVRFWGHDGALEVAFFVEDTALSRISPATRNSQAAMVEAFDNNRERIVDAARKAYGGRRQGSYVLTASDF